MLHADAGIGHSGEETNMDIVYKSMFAPYIIDMITYKKALGYSESTYRQNLLNFDRFCYDKHPKEKNITQELVSEWIVARPNENINGVKRRASAIRALAKYMNAVGIAAYVIPLESLGRDKPFTAYIYSNSELKSFFHAADQYPKSKRSPLKERTVPVLFRLIYSCGLRPQEARNLKCSDINYDNKTIYISDSKRHKDRVIPLDSEIMDICKKYDLAANVMFPSRTYFFQFCNKNIPCSNAWVDIVFRQCWKLTGIQHFHNGQTPRVYDFRHNYASRRIMQWVDESKDLNILIPYLSAYMGHIYLRDTFYYVHLIPDLIASSPGVDWNKTSDCIPEVLK